MTCQHFRRPSELVSVEQFKAFALDIQSMYQEGRVLPTSVEVEREEAQNNYMEEDDEEEEEVGLGERNLRTMIGMGFAKEDAEEALSRSSGSLQVALDLLLPLLISFGQSHPEVMRTIHENRETFVAMLYEQTGGATSRYARHH